MIRTEELRSVYDLPLSLYAQEEIVQAGGAVEPVLRASVLKRVIVTDRPLAAIGVLQPTLIGAAILWFLLCEDITRRDLVALRRFWPEIFKHFPWLQTGVEVGYTEGEKFAKLFGFQVASDPYPLFGRIYRQYEARG